MQPYGQVPAIGPVHATKAFPFPIVPFGRPFIAPFSIPPPPNTPRHLMPPPAKRILPPQSVTSTFATLASKTNAAPTVKPATLSLQLQPDKAAHLNTAAPAFVPRLLRTCTQTAAQNTGAKPPSTPAQPMLANARPAADLEKPKVLREFIPQHLMSSKQSPVHSGQQTQALQMSSAQPAAHTELLTHAEPAAEQPQQQGASDIQPAAALTHSASVAPALAVEAAQQDHHAVQSIAELNQAAVQSDQSGAALQHHMSQVDEQSTPQEDQHDLQYGARQDQLELPGPSEQFDQPAAAQNQSAGIANADMHSVASSGSLDTELHALDDATEQEASTLVDSEDAVPLSTLLDTLYMHYPLSLLPVVSVSAYRKPVAKAQELELLVHRGSEVAHQKQGECPQGSLHATKPCTCSHQLTGTS